MIMSKSKEIEVTHNPDGTFTIEWDENNPKYRVLNNLTEDQIKDIIIKNLEFHQNKSNKGD